MSDVERDRWVRIKAILEEVLDTPSEQRPALLERACGNDEALRVEIEALVAAADAAESGSKDGFLDSSAGSHAVVLLPSGEGLELSPLEEMEDVAEALRAWRPPSAHAEEPALGTSVGPYRITRKLGEGGMGIVYEAEQDRPRRRVALKLVRGGAFDDAHRHRLFQREIHTLARLQHPNVAAIYEAGRTGEGQHYFAMELVDGCSLNEHLAKLGPAAQGGKAGIRARLELFLEICEGMSYAHQRGVIHRDLKPSNLFVTEGAASGLDGAPAAVKILDFGLARITDEDLSMSLARTEFRTIQGTLPYMSPEQARGNPDEIDLRSDVYALGVVLYEMLTGCLPYDVSRSLLHESLRIICEQEPRKVGVHVPLLRGDLETIVAKALEKSPQDRYQSVSALAEDIRRHLTDLPIHARAPSTIYQLRKLAARHRTAAALLAGLAVALLAGVVGTSIGLVEARRAEARAQASAAKAREEAEAAQRVSSLLEGIFKVSDPSEARGNSITAREILDRGVREIHLSLADQPRLRERLLTTLGAGYRNLGLYDDAHPILEDALAARRAALGDTSAGVARAR